jgi:hypothetical protein
LKKYSKKSKKCTKLEQVVPGSVGGLNKKLEEKKGKHLPNAGKWH